MAKALIDLTEDELRDALRRKSENVIYSANDMATELDRREVRSRERVLVFTAVLAAGASIVSAVIALVAVLGR